LVKQAAIGDALILWEQRVDEAVLMVFNIAGNKFRLITAIHINTGTVYIRDVLTHSEYDKGRWKP
jgi:mRNA interferase HigB